MMCIVVLSLRVGVVVVDIAYQNHRVTHSPPSVHAKVSRYIIYYTKKMKKCITQATQLVKPPASRAA